MSPDDIAGVEERIRTATRARTDLVRNVRSLELPDYVAEPVRQPSRNRRWSTWSGWFVPLTAAAAVIAVAATLVVVRGSSGPVSASHSVPATGSKAVASSSPTPAASNTADALAGTLAAEGVPQYYVTLNDVGSSSREAMLRATATGAALETFPSPLYADWGVAAGSGSDGTFVLSRLYPAPTKPGYAAAASMNYWVLHVDPSDPQKSQLTHIPITTSFVNTSINGAALSPDGRTLAIAYQRVIPSGELTGPMILQLYSVATGKLLHTWTGYGVTLLQPKWLGDDHTLAWGGEGSTQAISTLNVDSSGTDLTADSRQVFSVPTTCGYPLLSLDGKSVICGYNPEFSSTGKVPCSMGQPALTSYSVATGKLEHVLYRYQGTSCMNPPVTPVWAASGSVVVAEVSGESSGEPSRELGVATPGKLTQLPFTQEATSTTFDSLDF